MSLIDRFTRDSASKYIWSLMTLLALIGVAYTVTRGWAVVDQERLASQARAADYVHRVIALRFDPSAPDDLAAAVDQSILGDDRVARVRIWSTDGELLFSSDSGDQLGSKGGLNDALLSEASRDGTITRSDVSDTGGADDPDRSLLRTYVPLDTDAVVEIDQTNRGTLAPLRAAWMGYRILAGVVLLLFLVFTSLSLRESFGPINVGVPFASSSVPPGFSVIDNERLRAVEEVYRLASERVARMKRKLAEADEARRLLEGEVQRALSTAAANAPQRMARAIPPASQPVPPAVARPTPTAPPTPPAAAPAAAPASADAAQKGVVQVPESEVVTPSNEEDPAASGPLARAARDQKPPPTSRRAKPAPEKPRGGPKQKGKPQEASRVRSAPEPEPTEPEPTEPEPKEPVRKEPERQQQPTPAQGAPAREVAAVGAKSSRSAAPVDQDAAEAKAHEAALETFIRLTESDRQHHEATEVDQGEVRAALARTAARKKPRSERLRAQEESEGESPIGPPKSA